MSETQEDVGATERVLGTHGPEDSGRVMVVLGGLHGNEPTGVVAARRVLTQLREREVRLAGRFIAVVGNRAALERGVRFVDRDLNRRWIQDDISALLERDPSGDSVEDREQRELLELIDTTCASADEPVVFVDLHATSGPCAPFACMSDTLRNRRVALALPMPVVLGLEEVIDSALLGHVSDLGHCGIAVEGGRSDDPLFAYQWTRIVRQGLSVFSDDGNDVWETTSD